jgi:pseudaminic acid biosynthesis-associated methylase
MDQRSFWAGEFGFEYISRNNSDELLGSNLALFAEVFRSIEFTPDTIIEFGANIGMNIKALRLLFPNAAFSGVEINAEACEQLGSVCDLVFETSIEEYESAERYDLVLTKGVLIHINPESLPIVYKKLVDSTNRWLLVAEYYNPTPVGVDYRGHSNKLFKRDFVGEILDSHPNLKLRNYGFRYRRGIFPQDDITWFLLEKSSLE